MGASRHKPAVLICLVLFQQWGTLAAGAALTQPASPARSSSSIGSRPQQEAGQFFGVSINLGSQAAPPADAATLPAAQTRTTSTTLLPGLLSAIPGAIASVFGVGSQPVEQQQPQQQQQQQQKQKQQPPPTASSSLVASGPPLPQQQQKVYRKKQQPKVPRDKLAVVAAVPSYVPQHPAGTVPMCEWRSDFNQCQVHRHHYLALKEKPTSYIAQTITAASARDYACSAHTQPAACQEASQGLRCGWNLSGGRSWDASGCRSYYMAEWTVFGFLIGAGVPAAQAAVGLTNLGAFSCPGSLAARALTCNTAYPMDRFGSYDPNMCAAAAPGCTFQQASNSCVMSPGLTSHLQQLKAADVGTCSAACYLRVLSACPAGKSAKPQQNAAVLRGSRAGKTPLSDPSSCWASPGCTWSNGVCQPDLYSSQLDSWGRKVAAAAEACSREKEAWGCGQAGAKGLLPLPSAAVQAALQRGLPGPGKENARCSL